VVVLGLYDTYFALILTYMVFTLPYAILMMTGYFNTLPRELDDAVKVDGGSNFFALWRVLVPISVPGIVATAVYTFLLAWNEFLFALTLTKSTEMRTVPIGIQLLMGQHAYEWNQMMAMSLFGSLPILIIYLVAQRYFLAGMTAGSVKARAARWQVGIRTRSTPIRLAPFQATAFLTSLAARFSRAARLKNALDRWMFYSLTHDAPSARVMGAFFSRLLTREFQNIE
jgi:ABC-type anion transport system duplicated permease subunit